MSETAAMVNLSAVFQQGKIQSSRWDSLWLNTQMFRLIQLNSIPLHDMQSQWLFVSVQCMVNIAVKAQFLKAELAVLS